MIFRKAFLGEFVAGHLKDGRTVIVEAERAKVRKRKRDGGL